MAGEYDKAKWFGIRPTNPAENIPVDVKSLTGNVPIIPADPEQNIPVDIKVHTVNTPIIPSDPEQNIPVDIKVHTVNTPIIPSDPAQNIPVDVKSVTGNVSIIPSDPEQNIPVDVKAVTGNIPVVPASPEEIFTVFEGPNGTTHIQRYGTAQLAETTLYTVPANYILYVVTFELSVYSTIATGIGHARFRDSGSTVLADFFYCICPVDTSHAYAMNFNPPWQLVATDRVQVISTINGTYARGLFTGYLRDA